MSRKKYELTEAEEAAANLQLEREREYLKDILEIKAAKVEAVLKKSRGEA